MDIQTILSYEFFGNTGENYLVSFFIFAEFLIIFKIFQLLILRKCKKLAEKSSCDVDDFIVSIAESFKLPFYLFVSLYIASTYLNIPDDINRYIYIGFLIFIVFQVILTLQRVVDYGMRKFIVSSGGEEKDKEAIIRIGSVIVKIALWVIGLLLVLSNLGLNITSLVTGLGIGGIAIALAVQNILEDVFTSFSILIDKPFKVGDFIQIDKVRGTVKKIGIKTTRIQTPQGEEVVISNKDLTSARLHNFKKMEKRRTVFYLDLVYGTPKEKLEMVDPIFKKIISKLKLATYDRVHLKELGPYSFRFEISYYVKSSKYRVSLDIQEKINYAIYDEFKKARIEIAIPIQEVVVKRTARKF